MQQQIIQGTLSKEQDYNTQNRIQFLTEYQKNILLEIEDFEDVKTIQIMIYAKEGIHPDFQNLFINGQELEDHRQLSDYKYTPEDTLSLTLKEMEIKVRYQEKEFPLKISHLDNISSLQMLILNQTPIDPTETTFLLNNEEIQQLDFCSGFQAGCTIYLFQTEFQYFVQSEIGCLQLEGSSGETISTMIEKIYLALNIFQEDYMLIYQGDILEGSRNLQFYQIKENSCVILEFLPIILHVQNLTGQTITLDAFAIERIIDFNSKIQNKEGIPPDAQRLIFAGIDICKDRYQDKLLDFGITNNSILYLVLKLWETQPTKYIVKRPQDGTVYEFDRRKPEISDIMQDIKNELKIPLENQIIYCRKKIFKYGKLGKIGYCRLFYLLQPRVISEQFRQKEQEFQIENSNEQIEQHA